MVVLNRLKFVWNFMMTNFSLFHFVCNINVRFLLCYPFPGAYPW